MNKREKMLAIVVGSLVPIVLGFWALMSFSDTYFSRQQTIRSLQSQISDEEDRILAADLAQQRRAYFRKVSLPDNVNQALVSYEDWFNGIVKNSGLKVSSYKADPAGTMLKFRGNTMTNVAEQFLITVKANGTLDQLATFLEQFYSLELLHRVNKLNITKLTADPGKISDSDNLRIDLEIQLLKLMDTMATTDFASADHVRNLDMQASRDAVLARNFFGPANNAPVVSTSSESAYTDEDVAFDVRVDDADRNDTLKIELVSTNIPDAKFEQKDSNDRRASFSAPKLEVGDYEMVVRVEDSGLPRKSAERTIKVSVKERPVREVKADPPKPKFKHAQGSYITGIVGDSIWISLKTKGEKLVVPIGDSFDLDEKKWTLIRIDDWRSIVIECEGNLFTYQTGDTLDAPRDTKAKAIDTDVTANVDGEGS